MQNYTEEQMRLIKIAVSYLSANLDDVNEMLCADKDIKANDVFALMKTLKNDNGTL